MSSSADAPEPAPRRRRVEKPSWLLAFEQRLTERLLRRPTVVPAIKLVVVVPLLLLVLRQIQVLPATPALVGGLLVVFFVLDYLHGLVARARIAPSHLHRALDGLTDLPLLLVVAPYVVELLPSPLLGAKIGVELLLWVLYVAGRDAAGSRLGNAVSYGAVIAVFGLSQGWAPRVITPRTAEAALWASTVLSGIVGLYALGLLQKRFIADALSAANLLCGGFAIWFSTQQRFEISLLFVLLGAAFDGFDGAAARRFGGTKIGVYSDDVADGVNYGISPAVALYCLLGGLSGALLGVFYGLFVVSRLVFFTLMKSASDPNYFRGVPSPVGGLTTMSSIVVFREQPAIVGLMVGIACAQMVAFSTDYRHLGRAVGGWVSRRRRQRGGRARRRALFGATLYILVLLLGIRLFALEAAVGFILVANLAYGFTPSVLAFKRAIDLRRELARRRGASGVLDEPLTPVPDGEASSERGASEPLGEAEQGAPS
ncbi:CDP-alcohol phosphatidyltransferase family protein [Paraliomyxa miuraensis]|uniref:CDP-alcohol phosphatidyltransferase family protein n=1 Tax=Paraliomyxa miuraensis TaxID=376150 RepID=UPI0022553138|nr:CDP-alcohol phosphatidyltransferase family protein [Paraliomyxa miuraensis]MCX4240126.1 CDP-alcohol phosphatidyltransferase family protein [Paraliomyxa miuraensis]